MSDQIGGISNLTCPLVPHTIVFNETALIICQLISVQYQDACERLRGTQVCTAHNARKGHARQKMVASLQGPTLPYASMTDTWPFQLRATLRGAPSTITITSCPCPINEVKLLVPTGRRAPPRPSLAFINFQTIRLNAYRADPRITNLTRCRRAGCQAHAPLRHPQTA